METKEIIASAFIARTIYGIDPGKSNGGVSKYDGENYEVWPMRKMADFEDMVDFWKYQAEIADMPLVFLEKITTFAGTFDSNRNPQEQSAHAGKMYQMNKLKDHYAEIRAALKVAKMPFVEAMPRSWQSYIGILKKGEDYQIRKRRYIDIARDNYPYVKVTAWNSDALLLLEFARKKLKYDHRWIRKNMTTPKQRVI